MTVLFNNKAITIKAGTELNQLDPNTLTVIGSKILDIDTIFYIDDLTSTVKVTPSGEIDGIMYSNVVGIEANLTPMNVVGYYGEIDGMKLIQCVLTTEEVPVEIPYSYLAHGAMTKINETGELVFELSPDAWGFGGGTTKYISNIDIYNSNYIIKDKEARASIENKQDIIDDLDNIRVGAELGATAYQKPSTGIPKTDLASDVQTSLGKADTAIQNTDDCVHTTGNETIAGVKTFSSNPVITSGGLNIHNIENGIIQHAGINFLRNSPLGATIISATANGTDHTIYLRPNGDTSTSNQVTIDTNGNLTATKFTGPLTGNVTGNCSGSSGSCTGNSATATKATQDSAGNTINTTYQRQWYSKYSISTYASSNPYIKLATVTFNDTTNYNISNLFWVEIQGADINMSAYALVRLSARWNRTAYENTKFEILEKYGQGASVFDSLVWAYKFTTSDSKASIVGEIWMKTRNSNYISYYFRPTQCNEYSDFAQSTVKANSTYWTYYDKAGTSTAIASTAITSGYTQVAVTENFSSPKKQYSILSSTSNWNDFTNYGCYKVTSTAASMVATYNAPVGEFGAGLLVVEKSYVSDEDRIVQIYYPNDPKIAPMWQRVRNGGNWRSWSPANAIKTSYVNGTSGYNIWYNGYCEQWGCSDNTARSVLTVTYLKTFKDTNYYLSVSDMANENGSGGYDHQNIGISGTSPYSYGLSTTGFRASTGSYNFVKYSWKASGYLASGQY